MSSSPSSPVSSASSSSSSSSSSSYNPNISNGTCYYSENSPTKGNFVPCGNVAFQTWPCCQLGDFCLGLGDSNSCWNYATGNTYVAGCTDPTFTSPHCQHKPEPFHQQEWVAIDSACSNLNSDSSSDGTTNWTGCKVADNSTELFKLPQASCTPYCSTTDIVYAGSSSLAQYASLPSFSGSSIFWQNNFTPPTAVASGYTPAQSTATSILSPSSTSTQTSPSSTSSTTATSSASPDGLSTGAKAGIGVGAGVGGLILLALLWFACAAAFRRRRLAAQPNYGPGMPVQPPPPAHNYQPYNMPTSQWSPNPGYSQYPSETSPLPVQSTTPYTGYKSELPGDEPTTATTGSDGLMSVSPSAGPRSTVSPVLSTSNTSATLGPGPGHSPVPGVAEMR